jgi:sporulation protein YlmC with PRC-barrel domain
MSTHPTPLRVDFHLLDRQVVDLHGRLVGKVDDIELTVGEDGVPVVTALLIGQRVLGERIGGRLGRWTTGLATRLQGGHERPPLRIGFDHVAAIGSAVELAVVVDVLETPPLEAWLRRHLIGRIPGARDARQ